MRSSIQLFLLVFVGITVMLATAPPAQAQSGPACRIQYQFCGLCGDIAIPGTTVCSQEITILSICTVPSNACSPDAASDETCPKCVRGGKPISLTTGDTYIEEADVRLPGLGGGLALSRIWNSKWPASQTTYQNTGIFGPNWRST
jgi:uncharacterized protein DUF6531